MGSEEPQIEIDVLDLPSDMRLEVPQDGLSEIDISEASGKCAYFYRTGRRSIPIRALDRSTLKRLLEISRVKFGNGGNAASAKFPLRLNSEIAYLVGALRDGTISHYYGKYEVSYVQKDVRWLRFLKRLIETIFEPSNRPRIIVRTGYTPKLTFSNRVVFEYFKRVFDVKPGRKVDWNTPQRIKGAPLELQKSYVRGYFDADGVSGINVGFCQANLETLLFIKGVLNKLGIRCRDKIETRKTSKGNDFYYLYVRTADIEKFFMLIGSSNPSKTR
jgi:hypothetical protein